MACDCSNGAPCSPRLIVHYKLLHKSGPGSGLDESDQASVVTPVTCHAWHVSRSVSRVWQSHKITGHNQGWPLRVIACDTGLCHLSNYICLTTKRCSSDQNMIFSCQLRQQNSWFCPKLKTKRNIFLAVYFCSSYQIFPVALSSAAVSQSNWLAQSNLPN